MKAGENSRDMSGPPQEAEIAMSVRPKNLPNGVRPVAHTSLRVELNARTFLFAAVATASVWLLAQLWPVLLVIAVALMIVGTLTPFVAFLERHRVRRNHAITLVFASHFVIAGLFLLLTVPRFVAQASSMVERLPQTQTYVEEYLEKSRFGATLGRSLRETNTSDLVATLGRVGFAYSSKVVEVCAYAVTSFFLALYVMIDRDRLRGGVFALIPRGHHLRWARILLNLETIVGGYMRGQLITSLMMAVFAFAVLAVAQVPNALALSLFAGLADVLPYVGAVLVCVPAGIAALSRGTTVAIVVLVALVIYQEVESRFIVPRIYGKVLRLPAAVVMVALLVGGNLLGIVGALLALPVAAGILMIVEELRVELPGEPEPDAEVRELDEAGEREFERRAQGEPAAKAAAIASNIAEARREHDSAESDALDPPPHEGIV